MTDQRLSAVLAALPDVRAWQEPLYRDLHQHPELSFQEHRTATVVADKLVELGYQVTANIGGTGVVGILRNGAGPSVLMRADIDALPVPESTGLPYASVARGIDPAGDDVPVMHACGHDMHVSCLLGAAALLAGATRHWSGTAIALFQPAEELGRGAAAMVDDGLAATVGAVDVALAQHVGPGPSGFVGTCSGPLLAAADGIRVTVYGRGGHGAMPQATVDPVVLAAMIVIRLQTIVAREVAPSDAVVLTVGSIQSGTKSNVIGDRAVLELSLRTYDEAVRAMVIAAIKRIVIAECQASDSPREPEFEFCDQFPVTRNDDAVTARVRDVFAGHFGDRVQVVPPLSASEDFAAIPAALGVPYTYWIFGGVDVDDFTRAAEAGRIAQDIPVNHSPNFAPVLQPTLDTGTEALVVAALAWL